MRQKQKQKTKTKPVAYPGWHTPGGKPRMNFWRPWVNLRMAPLGRGEGLRAGDSV